LRVDTTAAAVEVMRTRGGAVRGALSGGILLRYKHGPRIDEHDMVLRFNDAPTRGFEDFVGTKTTFRLVTVDKAGFHEGDEMVIMQMQSKAGLLVYNQLRWGGAG